MSTLRTKQLDAINSSGAVRIASGSKIVGTEQGQIYAPGSVIQMQQVQTAATVYSFSAADITPITGLSITITPKFATSALVLQSMINTSATYVSSYGFLRNSRYLVNSTATNNSNSAGAMATLYHGTNILTDMWNVYLQYIDIAGSTDPITYQVAGCSSWAGTNFTLYVNDRNTSDMRSISSMIIMEIAA